ncbi:helix-turn-helix domain-containing protein [Nocardia terpenica]|uniref:Helix-turn-helix domain-containing protein n=1 Tax=Nocardia terpenica TaxID=455432 RepID=A0A6G9YZ36_9NOCA|nr:helix-turn-helix transcriptional regulator [Nocardia terpenica]QIS18387.1 helix-turn-helix domain-containing protein [Nocardia terpenica]
MSDDSSTVPLRQLGQYLTDWRSRAGLTQAKAAELLDISSSSLQRLEQGQNSRPNSHIIQAAGELYGAPEDLIAAFVGLSKKGTRKRWWHQYGDLIPVTFNVYVGLEARAVELRSYQPELIPGLLQIPAYNRELERLAFPDDDEAEIERRVQIRVQRQHIVKRMRQPVRLDVVIGEAAVRRILSSRAVMAAQIRYLADMSTKPNISIRLLPFEAGFPDGNSMTPFVILDFGQTPLGEAAEPTIVFLEGSVGEVYLEDEDDVRFYHQSYESLRNAALDDIASRDRLRQIAWEHEKRER